MTDDIEKRIALQRVGWLRAAVLGANDGIVSTASLLVGVAAADASHGSSADGRRRGRRGRRDVDGGRRIRVRAARRPTASKPSSRASAASSRPTTPASAASSRASTSAAVCDPELAKQVADAADGARRARRARARRARHHRSVDRAAAAGGRRVGRELRLRRIAAARWSPRSRPVHAALVAVPATALVFLASLGAVAARAGGAAIGVAAARVTFWGALAMAATAGIGQLFGTIVQ